MKALIPMLILAGNPAAQNLPAPGENGTAPKEVGSARAANHNTRGTGSQKRVSPSEVTPAAEEAPASPLPENAGKRRGPHPIIALLDQDGNGGLSSAETANAVAVLRSLDENGDGRISRNEFFALTADAQSQTNSSGAEGEMAFAGLTKTVPAIPRHPAGEQTFGMGSPFLPAAAWGIRSVMMLF